MKLEDLAQSYRKSKALAHAYAIEGSPQTSLRAVSAFLAEEMGEELVGNPDAYVHDIPALSIEDVREIQAFASTKAVRGGRKLVVLSFAGATRQAENALLKTVEEPHEGAFFFILVPLFETLLPTLRSRLIRIEGPAGGKDVRTAEVFLKTPLGKRLGLLKPILDGKDKEAALAFLGVLQEVLRAEGKGVLSPENAEALRRVGAAARNLRAQGSSLKMILEHVALTTPELT